MKIFLTVDVEREPKASGGRPPLAHVPLFLRFWDKVCRENRAPSTLFLTGEVALNFRDQIRDILDLHHIGVHCHPSVYGAAHDKLERLSGGEQKELIGRDKKAVEESLSVRAESFRAGRLSKNGATLRVIRELGFRIDSSELVPYFFRPRALREKPWEPHVVGAGLVEVPVLAFDARFLDWTFKLKRFALNLFGEGGSVCVGLHSWFISPTAAAQVERLVAGIKRAGWGFADLGDALR